LTLYPSRQAGISLIPAIITVFIFALLTIQVIIPNQSRELREAEVAATANTADKLVQASLAYRTYQGNWTDDIDQLVEKGYLPVFTNNGWEIVSSTEQTEGVILQIDTGGVDIARALVHKIGTSAQICTFSETETKTECDKDPNGTAVKVAVVPPVDHYVQNLTVGSLHAGQINEDERLLLGAAPDPSSSTEATIDKLTVTKELTVGLSTDEPGEASIYGDLTIDGDVTIKNGILTQPGGSSKRYKQNIRPLEVDANKIYQLQAVSYDYKDQFKHYQTALAAGRQLGLIAEQVDAVVPELAIRQGEQIVNVDYEKLGVLLLQAVQQLKTELVAVQTQNQQLKAQLDALTNIE